jgi:ubiquinone/menaquinone biosynthesis C-methylase UbiE
MMADSYNQNEPHYRPENRAKVRGHLERLKASTNGRRLLDVGCGTGFVIDLAKDLFCEIDGVDITQAMLDKVDCSGGVIRLHNTPAQKLPFPDATFDAVTAYAFLHHLEDYRPVLQEMARVLRPRGQAYVDLEPNRLFWESMTKLEAAQQQVRNGYSDIVRREINSVLHTDDRVQKEFNISPDIFNKAEYTKSILGGIDPWQFRDEAIACGFTRCDVHLEWFLGQGAVMHGQSFEAADTIATYLQRVSPLSAGLFKYLRFQLVK